MRRTVPAVIGLAAIAYGPMRMAAGVLPHPGTAFGGLVLALAVGALLAMAINNLPAAAALHPGGTAGLWAAILATAVGPGLLLTGSVATVICRRIARNWAAISFSPMLASRRR